MGQIDHPALASGRTAVITGGSAGIGLAVAQRLAAAGMNLWLADCQPPADGILDELRASGAGEVAFRQVDVACVSDLITLQQKVFAHSGEVGLLMNNAAVGGSRGQAWASVDGWTRSISVNLMGVAHGVCAFTQAMIDSGKPGVIVNTGSKQGMTNPPGDATYNAAKAAVISLTESLAHDLRAAVDSQLSAHLLVPGFTYTSMIARHLPEKPAAAWLPEQVAEAMVTGILAGDFYILCPDNEVTRAMDERRVLWDAGDIVENRPALSRWHPDHAAAFAAFMAGEGARRGR
jgi:NAD(P)-dependent dehydrogenase (short-subunit alcohol dehydrogenase family)